MAGLFSKTCFIVSFTSLPPPLSFLLSVPISEMSKFEVKIDTDEIELFIVYKSDVF